MNSGPSRALSCGLSFRRSISTSTDSRLKVLPVDFVTRLSSRRRHVAEPNAQPCRALFHRLRPSRHEAVGARQFTIFLVVFRCGNVPDAACVDGREAMSRELVPPSPCGHALRHEANSFNCKASAETSFHNCRRTARCPNRAGAKMNPCGRGRLGLWSHDGADQATLVKRLAILFRAMSFFRVGDGVSIDNYASMHTRLSAGNIENIDHFGFVLPNCSNLPATIDWIF